MKQDCFYFNLSFLHRPRIQYGLFDEILTITWIAIPFDDELTILISKRLSGIWRTSGRALGRVCEILVDSVQRRALVL